MLKRVFSSIIFTCIMAVLFGALFINVYAEDAAEAFLEGFLEGLSGEDDSGEEKVSSDISSVTITPGVIYEGNSVTISVTGCSECSSWTGDTLNIGILIENNGSLNLGFNAHAYAVNSIMARNNIYDMDCDVASGKKANTQLEIPKRTLEKYGISTVKYIDVLFWAYDNDKYFKEFETPVIRIETDQNDGIANALYGDQLLDENGIQIDYLGEKNSDYLFSITNNRGDYFTFDLENLSVNDYTSSDVDFDLYDQTTFSNCQYVFNLDIPSDFLSTNGITDISKINFSLAYRPLGDYFNEAHTSAVELYTDQLDGALDDGNQVTEEVVASEEVPDETIGEEFSDTDIEDRKSEAVSFPFESIKKGDRGDNVKAVQQKLIELGYLAGEADGAFGGMTEEAVLAFQRDKKLDATGIIGESTYNTLMGGSSEEGSSDTDMESASDETKAETSEETDIVEHITGAMLDSVEILDSDNEIEITDAGYSISNGYLYFSVFLHNNSQDKGYDFPTVRVTARNAEGTLLGTEDQVMNVIYPESDYVYAGFGFEVNEVPSKVEFEVLVDDYNIMSKSSLDQKEYLPLEVSGINEREDEFFGTTYLGEVLNPNTYDLDLAAVRIVFRDENGTLLGGDGTYIDNVKAGRTTPFEINPSSDLQTENYEIYATSW